MEDIGALLFVQLLGMTQYPGSPFTGNLFKDIIMFFIVPTIFIIIVVYSMTGKIVPGQARLRVMLGVGAYLFIIAGGYYPAFALLAGPYFVILIFIVGILGYFSGHFTGSRPAPGGGGAYRATAAMEGNVDYYKDMSTAELEREIRTLKEKLGNAQERGSKDEAALYAEEIRRLEREHRNIEKTWLSKRKLIGARWGGG